MVILFHKPSSAQTHQLTVKTEHIQLVQGFLQMGLFNHPEGFLEPGSEFRVAEVPVDSTSVLVIFDSLPEGIYGISLYHDLDSSATINKNFIGIPTEPWGISNDVWHLLSAPKWKEARFNLAADTTIVIHLRD